MILGLVESQRGRDAAAVAALRQAEAARPDDPLPSYYLGQALILVGQPDDAATALERSLARKPTRNDLLEIFQALGRVYQRAQKNDQALAVWGRLEQLFPDDLRVQEQIATALAEEGQSELALKRFEALAGKVTDPFRKVQLAMQAADLKVRLGRTEPALHDFETLLSRLRPDSWLYREVRHKIEEVFLRNDDQAGLAAYYERWIKKNPEDVEAVVRLGRCLASQGRAADAHTWYEKAVKLAPSRRELRLALIGQLAQDQKFAEAAAQYEALDKAEPNNPDTLREWGSLILRDTARPEAERKAAAAAVWRRLLDARPTDAVTAAQVADLFRAADMADDALALYRKAVDLAPGNPQYHEYVGEYLHTLEASGRGPGRLVEDRGGGQSQLEEPGPARRGARGVRLPHPGDRPAHRGRRARGRRLRPEDEAGRAPAQDLAVRRRPRPARRRGQARREGRGEDRGPRRPGQERPGRRSALRPHRQPPQGAGRGTCPRDQAQPPGRALDPPGPLPRGRHEARRGEPRPSSRAIAIDPRSVPAWTMAARLRESAGSLAEAADAFRRLAEIDRRNRTEYLTGVAKLEARLGRVDEALKAGRDLIAAAPGNPEHYQFFAELCFQLGKNDEGLDALRRAVRVNPNESKVILTLAETLAGQFRTEEAIEIYWKAFEKAEDLDAKLGMVTRLTELYLQRNQFDRLLARLQRNQKETQQQAQQREFAICLAQAYASSGDLGMARSELERLLAANARDVQLLQQLSKLSEEEGDFDSAAKYQKQLVELAPSDEGSTRLAQLYVRLGEIDEAQAVWSKQAAGKSQPDRVLQALDSLLANDKPRAALEVTEGLLRKDPRDWEALYREGTALMALDRADDAVRQFRALLDLRTADDEKGAIVKARTRDPKLNASAARPSRYQRAAPMPLEERIGQSTQIRMATKLESRYSYSRSQAYVWSPGDFGQARMAALGWMLSQAMKTGKEAEFLSSVRDRAGQDAARSAGALGLVLPLRDPRGQHPGLRGRPRAQPGRPHRPPGELGVPERAGLAPARARPALCLAARHEQTDTTPPLPAQEIDHVLASHRALRQQRPELVGTQVLRNVATELKRAKRNEEGDRLYREAVAGAERQDQIAGVFGLAAERGDVDVLIDPGREVRPAPDFVEPLLLAGVLLRGSGLRHGPGDERARRGEGVRRRLPVARQLRGGGPPQAEAAAGRRQGEELRQSLRRGEHAQLPDLDRQDPDLRPDQLPVAQRVLRLRGHRAAPHGL